MLYPRRCPACHEPVRGEGLICPECRGTFSYISEPKCYRCGKQIRSYEEELCRDCAARPKTFSEGAALFLYDEAARASLIKFKYGGRREYADFYAEEIAARFGEQILRFAPRAIIPVPVHVSRLRFRGFNQAQEIAERLAEIFEIPALTRVLRRTKKTTAQKGLNAAQRMANLMSAMEAGEEARELSRVLLVDDIYTTGSTMEACARVLRKAGAGEIMIVSVAAGMND